MLFRNTSTSEVSIWLMDGRTRLSGSIIGTLSSSNWSFQAFGDFNGDGRSDAIVRHATNGQIAMWEFTAGGALADGGVIHTVSDLNWKVVVRGDFNGDGDDELLWHHSTTNQMAMWELSGRALANGAVFATVSSSSWVVQGTGDMNNDGRDDIVFRHGTGALAVWDMNGRTIVNGNVVATISHSSWVIEAIGDYDGDGDDEIVYQNTTTRELAMWELSNHALVNGSIFFPAVGAGWAVQPPFDPVR